MKKINIKKTEIFARFVHVASKPDATPLRLQAVSEQGKLITAKCKANVYKRVLGERHGEKGNLFNLGLRNLTQVQFRAHYDQNDEICAIDIVPNRYFLSGAAPRVAGDNSKKGFDIHVDEDLNGFDVWSEDPNTGEKVRVAYAGLSDKQLYALLDELRKITWGNKSTVTVENHKFEKVEEGRIRCKPIQEVKYTT
jgi:hypothetical protein